MKKHYIALFLLAVFLPALIVPAHADSINDPVDLMNAVQYTARAGDTYFYNELPYFYFHSSYLEVSWDSYMPDSCSTVVLGLRSNSQPINVMLGLDGINLFGKLVGSHGNFYQYEFNTLNYSFTSGSIKASFVMPDSNNNEISILSVFGYNNQHFNIEFADYKYYRQIYSRTQMMQILDDLGSANNVSVPFDIEHQSTYGSNAPEELNYGRVEINLYPEQFKYSYLDALQVQYTASGVNYFSGLVIDRNTNEVLRVLDYVEYNGFCNSTLPRPGYFIDLYNFNLTFNLSGIDLSDCYIQLNVVTSPTSFSSSIDMQEGFYLSCDWIKGILPADDLPWYIDLANWFDKQFQGVYSWIEWVGDSIASWGQSIIDTIVSTGDSIIDALSPDTSGLDQTTDAMNSAASDFNAANDILDSSPKPNISDINGDISSIIDLDSISSNVGFFTVLVNQPTVAMMLSLSLILCTAAFVFFGKR